MIPVLSRQSGRRMVAAGGGGGVFNDPNCYFTCDAADTSGSTITDRGSDGNNGTLFNSPSSVTGHKSDALSFNGTTQKATAPLTNPTGGSNYGGDISVAFWIKVSAGSSGGQFSIRTAFYGDRLTALLPYVDNNFYLESVMGQSLVCDFTPYLGAWTHVMFVSDETANSIEVFVNNVLKFSSLHPSQQIVGDVLTSIVLGQVPAYGYAPAQIDEFRVYYRALSSADRAALYAF